MKRAALLLSVYLAACCVVYPHGASRSVGRSPGNITGRYELRYLNVRGSLNAQLLPNNRIKFNLVALLKTAGGETRNGEVEGTVPLTGNTAVYSSGQCTIAMKFLGNRVEVKESNVDDCGFGAFVTAQGTYIRKSRKPKFDS